LRVESRGSTANFGFKTNFIESKYWPLFCSSILHNSSTTFSQSASFSPSAMPPNLSEMHDRLDQLCLEVRKRPFYARHHHEANQQVGCSVNLQELPFLTKQDLINSATSGIGLFDLPREKYVRWHQTSGTTGRPLVVRDTAEDWRWWIQCWSHVFDVAQIGPGDIAMMAFSFGPFIGFWTANDSLVDRGVTVIPGGGLSTRSRLQMILEHHVTVLCATPTYALHLASVAASDGLDLASSDVRRIIVAGEPGGSLPSVRKRLESAFGATVIDHAGSSEVGAWGYGDALGKGLHVIQSEFIPEVIDFASDPRGRQVSKGETGELVLTGLGRRGGPAIRYRTGDIVRPMPAPDDDPNLWLEGGVIGRADDMVVVRGVNVFPSSVEAIIREDLPTEEYRVTVFRAGELDQLSIEAECGAAMAEQLSQRLSDRLAIKIQVQSVPENSLPRFEAKSHRWIDRRHE
jgi:phenylacetate-CoA ligase